MATLPTEFGEFAREQLETLSERPNTTVYEATHDQVAEPWASGRVSSIMESIAARATTYDPSVHPFRMRKALIEDPETLAFQRQHPRIFDMLTDREMLGDPRFRNAIKAMLHVRREVEAGRVAEGQEAEGLASRGVLAALQQDVVAGPHPPPPPAGSSTSSDA